MVSLCIADFCVRKERKLLETSCSKSRPHRRKSFISKETGTQAYEKLTQYKSGLRLALETLKNKRARQDSLYPLRLGAGCSAYRPSRNLLSMLYSRATTNPCMSPFLISHPCCFLPSSLDYSH